MHVLKDNYLRKDGSRYLRFVWWTRRYRPLKSRAPFAFICVFPGLWFLHIFGYGPHYINYDVYPRRLWTVKERENNMRGRRLQWSTPTRLARYSPK